MIIFEITSSWVKALWGKSVLKDVRIDGVVSKPIESDSQENLVKIVSSIGDENTFFKKYKPVILCIPRSQATLRNLKFPSKDQKELDNIINLHLTQQVPYAREEIVYNYADLGKNPSGFTEILLGILHRELLIKQFSLFERFNLYPENVLLSTSGLMRFLRMAKAAKDNDIGLKACLDIDSEFSDFLIFRGSQIFFSKSIAIGYSQLKEEDKLTKFIGEIKQALVVFQAEKREALSRFYISGVTQKAIELEANIKEALNVPVETIDTISTVSSLKEIKDLKDVLGNVSISALLGVASKPSSTKLNFILPEAKMKKDVKVMTKNLVVTGSIVIYLFVLILLGFTGRVYNRQTYLDKLTTEMDVWGSANKESTEALESIKAVRNFTKEKDSFLYYYYELTKIIPENITVDRLIFSKNKEFSTIGKGTDMGEIFRFVRILNKENIFGKVELRYSRKKTKGESEFNEFEIMCHVK